MENVKIHSLEMENIKRVKAVKVEFAENGLTVIGGRNGQGKTSILDAIAWGLGGAKYEPTAAVRDGSYAAPKLEVQLNNGLIVTRSGANSTLKVVDPSGAKAGQKLLDSFISQFSLDLPKFMNMNDKDKASELLKLLDVEDELIRLEAEYNSKYTERREIGRIADSKDKHAKEMPAYDDVPEEPVSALELIQAQQEILARNGENQRKRARKSTLESQADLLSKRIESLEEELNKLEKEHVEVLNDIAIANMETKDLEDGSTAELEEKIANVEQINAKVRANQAKLSAVMEAGELKQNYDDLSKVLDDIKDQKKKLLESVKMPIAGLGIEDGTLTYDGKKWDCMSGAEQLKVSAAIAKALKPECGFILMDKLEQMDAQSLLEFGKWAQAEGLQIIATRVSTNKDECQIIIEDGQVVEDEKDWGGF